MQLKFLHKCAHLYNDLYVQLRQFFFLLLKNSARCTPNSEQPKAHEYCGYCGYYSFNA